MVAPAPEWLTTKQAAALCGVSRWWLWRHRTTGAPPAHQRGTRVLYRYDEVLAWMEKQRR